MLTQVLISGALAALFWYLGKNEYAASLAVACGLILVNWIALVVSWGALLFKKSIALGIGLIVTKYAFFALVLIWLSRQTWFEAEGWLVAIVALIVSLLFEAFAFRRRDS